MSQNDKRIVVALGGNAILRSKNLSSYHEQFENVRRSCRQVVQLIMTQLSLAVGPAHG